MGKPGPRAPSHWRVKIPRGQFTRQLQWILGRQNWKTGSITIQRNVAACGYRRTKISISTKLVSFEFVYPIPKSVFQLQDVFSLKCFPTVVRIWFRFTGADTCQGSRWARKNAAHWDLCKIQRFSKRSILLDYGKYWAKGRFQALLHTVGRRQHRPLSMVYRLPEEPCRSSHLLLWRALVSPRFERLCYKTVKFRYHQLEILC